MTDPTAGGVVATPDLDSIAGAHAVAVSIAKTLADQLRAAHEQGTDREPDGSYADVVLRAWLFVDGAIGADMPAEIEEAVDLASVSARLP